MGLSKTSDYIQITIKMPNPSQEPPASSKAPNEDLKDMYVLCTFNIKTETKILIMVASHTRVHIQIKIKMPNPSQEPPASSKAPNDDLMDMDILCTFKIKIEGHNSGLGFCILIFKVQRTAMSLDFLFGLDFEGAKSIHVL